MKSHFKVKITQKQIAVGENQIELPEMDIEVDVEYTPQEIIENFNNFRNIIKQMPDIIDDLKEVADKVAGDKELEKTIESIIAQTQTATTNE